MAEIKSPNQTILGIDPGTNIMGYGVIYCQRQEVQLIQFGVIKLEKYTTYSLKLKKIYDRVSELIRQYAPNEMALEAPFYGKNVQSMLKLGRAQGVAMAAALAHQLPIHEYAPKRVKQAVTGNGNASKEQVAAMMKSILKFNKFPNFLDATDALAIALCHHYSSNHSLKNDVPNSWKAFLSKFPRRIKEETK